MATYTGVQFFRGHGVYIGLASVILYVSPKNAQQLQVLEVGACSIFHGNTRNYFSVARDLYSL